MIEYSLLLEDGTSFSLNGASVTDGLKKSTTVLSGGVARANTLAERTNGDGSAVLARSRTTSGKLTLRRAIAYDDAEDCRAWVNDLMSALERVEYLVDVTHATRARVLLDTAGIEWDEGSEFQSGDLTVSLVQVDPYWESTNETTQTIAVDPGAPYELTLDNTGFSDAPFRVQCTVSAQIAPVELFEIQDIDRSKTLEFSSVRFGLDGFERLVIDTKEGEAYTENTDTGLMVDEQISIASGSGYFSFAPGENNLIVRCSVSASVVISYRRRFFV